LTDYLAANYVEDLVDKIIDALDQICTVTELSDIVKGVLRCRGKATINELRLKHPRNKQLHEVHKMVVKHLGMANMRLLLIKVLD
jgi:hypothetical protein